jgi:hypothetical protein
MSLVASPKSFNGLKMGVENGLASLFVRCLMKKFIVIVAVLIVSFGFNQLNFTEPRSN